MPDPISIIALISALAPLANSGIKNLVSSIGESAFGGPIEEVSGSLAQTGFNKLVSSLPTILSSPENHDLLRAVRRSYLNATLTMCFARLKILNPSKAEWKNLLSQTIPQNEEPYKVIEALRKGLQTNDADTNKEIEWLFLAIKELNQGLADIADWKHSEVIEQATKASELLLKPENANSQIEKLKEDLKMEVVAELARTTDFQTYKRKKSARKSRYWACLPPSLLENLEKGWFELEDDGSILQQSSEKVDFEWFDVMCVFFAEEIKTNTRVSDIFNARMLADLKYQNGQSCNFTAEMFAEKLAESNKILLERLTNIEKEVSGLGEFKVEVRNSFRQLIPLIVTVNDVAKIVKNLPKLIKDESDKTRKRIDELTAEVNLLKTEIHKNNQSYQVQLETALQTVTIELTNIFSREISLLSYDEVFKRTKLAKEIIDSFLNNPGDEFIKPLWDCREVAIPIMLEMLEMIVNKEDIDFSCNSDLSNEQIEYLQNGWQEDYLNPRFFDWVITDIWDGGKAEFIVEMLANLKAVDSIDKLGEIFKKSYPFLKLYILRTLRILSKLPRAIPKLLKIVDDKEIDIRVRERLMWAINSNKS